MPNILLRRAYIPVIANQGPSDTTAPTLTISVVSVTGNVAAMRIVASEEVTGFAVGDITISAGGSLASFATADNITFTVSWTLAPGVNTMDINAGVCTDAAGNNNTAATQYPLTYLILQPDATAGVDNYLYQAGATTNLGTNAAWAVGGDSGAGTGKIRGLIKFNLSSIAVGSTVYSAIFKPYMYAESSLNATTLRIYRMIQAWVETESTWNVCSTGVGWPGGAGAFGASDCEQTEIGSRAFSATETTGEFKNFVLAVSAIQEIVDGIFTNNGFMCKADLETVTEYDFRSSDTATAAQRPKLEIVYRPS